MNYITVKSARKLWLWIIDLRSDTFDSISLCLNASPLKEVIDLDYMFELNGTLTDGGILKFNLSPNPPTPRQGALNTTSTTSNVTTTTTAATTTMLPSTDTEFFEEYRKEAKSWMAWQDSFVLTVFILLILLSIGAIVAFKVLVVGLN